MSPTLKQRAEPGTEPGTELSRIARPLRLSEEVSGELQRRIARGELKPGDRLPTEKPWAMPLASAAPWFVKPSRGSRPMA